VTIRANPPLDQVTTRSLPALRKYSEGVRLLDQRRIDEAIPLLQEAIALDSTFAMAWRKLAVAYTNSFGSQEQEDQAATQAFRLRHRLPDTERELAAAYYYGAVENDPVKEATVYRSLLAGDSLNQVALNNLALNYNMGRRYAEAETLAVRGVSQIYSEATYTHVLLAQVAQGRLDAARATVEEAARRAPPGIANTIRFRAFLAMAEGRRDSAAYYWSQLRQEHRGSPEWQARTGTALAAIAETEGRLEDATQYLRAFMTTAEERRLPRDYFQGALRLARIEAEYRDRPAQALAVLEDALRSHPLASIPMADRPYLEISYINALAGRAAEARRVLREYETAVPESVRRGEQIRPLVYGIVAEAEGRFADASAAYGQYHVEFGVCGTCGLYEMARVHDRVGNADSARVLYERMVNTPTIIGHGLADPVGRAASYKRLGELYEAKGDRSQAAHYYERFVELWQHADPELQPGVAEVRRRLARLAQEPGT
jgi:tetratricopeptide (TPR) repeat protein